MQENMELLDLPEISLQNIFSYCKGQNILVKLTECCKYIKDFVETSDKLMNQLKLNVKTWHGKMPKRDKELLAACLNSTRIFRSVFVDFVGECFDGDDDDQGENGDITLKMLLQKHSETVREFDLSLYTNREFSVVEVLRYLVEFPNVEKISLVICYEYEIWSNQNGSSVFENEDDDYDDDLGEYSDYSDELELPGPPAAAENNGEDALAADGSSSTEDFNTEPIMSQTQFNFDKLKVLHLCTDYPMIFKAFQNCKTLKTLTLDLGEYPLELTKIYELLQNSSDTMESFSIKFQYADIKEDEISLSLIALKATNINLRSFELCLREVSGINIKMLMNFLRVQTNLETFILEGDTTLEFGDYENFGNLLADLPKLKNLDLQFHDVTSGVIDENEEQNQNQSWNLNNLQKLAIACWGDLGYTMTQKIFNSTSKNLKEIHVRGHFRGLQNIAMNFPNLVVLNLDKYAVEYSSNDIFWILKFLKKLQVLKFHFPDTSDLDPQLFVTTDDMKLPEITKVELGFNKSIKNPQVADFLQFLNNMSTFSFAFWENYDIETMDILTQQLLKLTHLNIENLELIDGDTLMKIDSNIQQFNENPKLFRINGKDIEVWKKKVDVSSSEAKANFPEE